MRRSCIMTRSVACLLMVAVLSAACATTSDDSTGRVVGTTIGAITGGIIGGKAKGTGGAVVGAAVGGAAGYLVGWFVDDYRARKTKSAQVVRQEHAVQEIKGKPVVPSVRGYTVRVNPEKGLGRGQEGEAITTFDLLAADKADLKVEEECSLTAPDGTNLLSKRYVYKEVTGGGGYEFKRKMPVPKEADEGPYAYAAKLYVNGTEAASTHSSFSIARAGDTYRVVLR